MIIDTHCHIHFPELFTEVPALIDNMRANDVSTAITVCTDLEELPQLRQLVADHECLYATVGVHPNTRTSARCDPDELVQALESEEKFIAVGESGLDYFREGRKARAWQLPRLEAQIEVAMRTSLPIVIHTRDSIPDTLDVLAGPLREGLRAVLHCFTGTWEQATRALDLGCMLSFTGIVTFSNAKEQLDVAKRMPVERIMVETDAPYLAPEPMRGKRNEPSLVRHTLERIANERDVAMAELAETTTMNARKFFNLPAS